MGGSVKRQLLTTQSIPAAEMLRNRGCREKEIKEGKKRRGGGSLRVHIGIYLRAKCNLTHTEENNSDGYIHLGMEDRIKAL